jgi:hypothetical protein
MSEDADLSLRELSDRQRIQDLVHREARALDQRDWVLWRSCYTDDADIDWSGNQGAKGKVGEAGPWLAKVAENFPFPAYQHYVTNVEIELDGDRGRAREMQIIAISLPAPGATAEGGRQMGFCGIWFEDEVVRTAAGWKIARRVEKLAWRHNFPEGYQTPEV